MKVVLCPLKTGSLEAGVFSLFSWAGRAAHTTEGLSDPMEETRDSGQARYSEKVG